MKIIYDNMQEKEELIRESKLLAETIPNSVDFHLFTHLHLVPEDCWIYDPYANRYITFDRKIAIQCGMRCERREGWDSNTTKYQFPPSVSISGDRRSWFEHNGTDEKIRIVVYHNSFHEFLLPWLEKNKIEYEISDGGW